MRVSSQRKYTFSIIFINVIFALTVFQVCLAEETTENQSAFTITLYGSPDKEVSGLPYISMIPSDGINNLLVYKNLLFGASFRGHSVSFFNLKTLQLTKKIQMDEMKRFNAPNSNGNEYIEIQRCSPGDLAVAGGKLFVGQVFSDFILAVDIETGEILDRIPVGGEGKLAVSPDGNVLFFLPNLKSEFYIIDPYTYQFAQISLPESCLGMGAVQISPGSRYLYLSMNRVESVKDSQPKRVGGPGLAVYDLVEKKYEAIIPLAKIEEPLIEDVSRPFCILPSEKESFMYVGMFQSETGIQIIDTKKAKVTGYIPFEPNRRNSYFKWVDPLSLAFYKDYLLSFNRNNAELVFVDIKTHRVLASLDMGMKLTSGVSIVIDGDTAYLSHPERKGILVINMEKLTAMITESDKNI